MYRKDYYDSHKEKYKEYGSNYRNKNRDKVRAYQKKYFQEHKEEITNQQKEWRKNNKDKWIKAIGDSRRRRVERLKEEGCTNPWMVVTRGAAPRYRKDV